jgi:hypothetical protein
MSRPPSHIAADIAESQAHRLSRIEHLKSSSLATRYLFLPPPTLPSTYITSKKIVREKWKRNEKF